VDRISEIKHLIQEILPLSQVILFGSRARRMHLPESDYDILVIIDSYLSPSEKMPIRTKIRKLLLSKGIFSDILIQSKLEVKTKSILPGHIIKTIMQEGVVL